MTTTEECADRAVYVLRHPREAGEIAGAGAQAVKERFLMPRLLRDELRLLISLLEGGAA